MKQIQINCQQQSLSLFENEILIRQYTVSTAKNGVGQRNGSEQTPLGSHIIRAKIGANLPNQSVFVARRPTGEIYNLDLGQQYPDRDWILTRILWLRGTEPGKNRFGLVDTMARFIYIHGTPDESSLGTPLSHGCIRMNNNDIIELFDCVDINTSVQIS